MSATASLVRKYWPEIGWGLFAAVNFAALLFIGTWETVPFHYVWVSLTLVYGFRVWKMRATLITLAFVCVASTLTYGWVVINGPQGVDELTEIPLMAAMFLAMVWHARRRQFALEAVSRAAKREHEFVRDASHKLKTPIAVALGTAELIRQSGPASYCEQDMDDLVEGCTTDRKFWTRAKDNYITNKNDQVIKKGREAEAPLPLGLGFQTLLFSRA